jgi:hypothetical protein
VGVEPGALRRRESLAVDSEAIVLVPFGEQVLLPDDGECGPFVLAEFCVFCEEAGLFERLRDLPPKGAFALLRLQLLPGCGLILARSGGDGAQFVLPWHVARADLIEDSGVDGRQQPQLADLADRNGERGRDGLFGPVFGGEAFYGAPEVNHGHWGAYDVFAHRPHLVVIVGVFDQDVDFGEADLYGDADPPRAVGDGELAIALGDRRRLQDADGVYAGGKRRVRHFAGLDFARVVGVRLEDSGIDATQFHLDSPDFKLFETFLEDETQKSAGDPDGAKAARSAGIRTPSEAAERTRPLRRLGVPCFRCLSFSVASFEARFL